MSSDPTAALQAMLTLAGSARFPANSRYAGVEIAQRTLADGRVVPYLRRRFAPQPQSLALLVEHTVAQGDRLDNLAARYLGDPELFWRICDGNAALRPDALVETEGGVLRVTLPEGMSGGINDA